MSTETRIGGIRLSVDIDIDIETLSTMPPETVAALMNGVALILSAREFGKTVARRIDVQTRGAWKP